jgi:hypothetical protein
MGGDTQRSNSMKDRRGHGNQAVLNHSEDTDIQSTNASYKAPLDGDTEIRTTPESVSVTANEPAKAAPAPTTDLGEAPASAPATAAPAASPAGSGEEDASPAGQAASGPAPASSAPAAAVADTGGPGPVETVSSTPVPANAPASSGGGEAPNSYAGDDMGWDAVAFAEAGGYDAVLTGSMPPGMCPGDGDGQDIFVFIDELNVDIINNTLIQNTEINLIADDGSVIDIGGDFTAIQTQESLIQDGPVLGNSGPSEAAFIPQDSSFIEADAAMA